MASRPTPPIPNPATPDEAASGQAVPVPANPASSTQPSVQVQPPAQSHTPIASIPHTSIPPIVVTPIPVLSAALRRREDHVDFLVFFSNLGRIPTLGAPLVRLHPTQDAFLMFVLPPQHLAEETSASVNAGEPVAAGMLASDGFVRARAARPTRLVFKLPPQKSQMDFTVQALLSWQDLMPVFAGTQLISSVGPHLEIPTGLVLAPHDPATVGWQTQQDAAPPPPGVPHELWHATLVVPPVIPGAAKKSVSFQATYVGPDALPPKLDLAIPSAANLKAIAAQSVPAPFDVDQLVVSGLGGWLDTHGEWQTGVVTEWRQRVGMGRDQFIRVVTLGWLCPWGHRASLIKIWERIVLPDRPVAGIWNYDVIRVRQPVCVYDDVAADQGRLPFSQIRILVGETPKLVALDKACNFDHLATFLQTSQNANYLMPLVGTDRDGHDHAFSAAALFVPDSITLTDIGMVQSRYEAWTKAQWANDPDPQGGRVGFGARTLGYASGGTASGALGPGPVGPGAAGIVTDAMRFTIVPRPRSAKQSGPEISAPFTPVMDTAQVRLSPLAHLGIAGEAPSVEAVYPKPFAIGPSAGTRFLEFPTPHQAAFDQRSAGGLAAPQILLGGIAVADGLVAPTTAAIRDIVGNTQILGGIDLANLLPDGALPSAIKTTPVYDGGDVPSAFNTAFDWQVAALQPWGGLFEPIGPQSETDPPQFELHASVTVGPGPIVTRSTHGVLRSFAINIAGILKLSVQSLSFASPNGGKPDFSAEVPKPPIEFLGPLAFLNVLMQNLPEDPFADPPAIAITPDGIVSSFSAALPNMPLGPMSLENVSVSAGLSLPFNGDPLHADFGFASREREFHLIVGALGGGGFLSLSGGAHGIDTVEAALEFGGSLSFDIGVASGGVAIMAGIYFKLAGSEVKLTGYLRASGALEVIGIISITVEFNLSLTYDSGPPQKIWGEAVVTVEVSIAFFSKSVDLHLRREFSNSLAHHFTDVFPADAPGDATSVAWTQYCQAFATDS